MRSPRFLIVACCATSTLVAVAGRTVSSEAATPRSVEFFEKRIRPILVAQCGECHGIGAGKVKGGLRVDSRASLLQGGDSGPALVPGEPAKSRVIDAIRYKNPELQMPPGHRLSDAAISDFETWVRDGATWPAEKAASARVGGTFDLARRKAEHWAWRPVRSQPLPSVKNQCWPTAPLDAFILAKLEEKGLRPALPADRRTLLRRVTFDLTGLPPTPGEIEHFQGDRSPDAFERVVDRLLGAPAYGERWARHWLDLVRYADSRGHEFDFSTPNAWQYRDYVIRAFNADVPYDQFVREHVAGDLLQNPRKHPSEGFDESILGTGFWLLGEEVHSPVDLRQDLADRLDNRIDVLTKAFLGLTVSCARCHDHKFDAISTKDYYALFGILEGASPRLVRFDSLEHNRRVAAALALAREHARPVLEAALAADAAEALAHAGAYLLAAREAIVTQPSCLRELGVPVTGRVADFSAHFRECLGTIARAHKLDAKLLAAWTAAVIAADKDVDDPLYAWAKVATDVAAGDAKRLAIALPAIADRLRRRPAAAAAALANRQVVIDYATSDAANWLPDEAAFGPGPEMPGSVRIVCDGTPVVQFSQEAAAVYNRAWDGIGARPGCEAEAGALGRFPRAGRTIRTPAFVLTTGTLCYRLQGTCTAYAAVEGHGLIAGPLHGQLIKEIDAGPDYRWVVHDLAPYKGCRVHVEFTATAGRDFALAKVIQAERQPAEVSTPAPQLLELFGDHRVESLEKLAYRYENLFRAWIGESDPQQPVRATNRADRSRFANWLLRHPELLTGDTLRHAAERLRKEQLAISAGALKESRTALALLDAAGVDEHVFIRGSPGAPGEVVPRRFLEALAGAAPIAPGTGSGRLQLAEQMTDPRCDPFLARVMVNRLWHHLFGRGLVASTDNFGASGDRPSHAELLDYLADQFVRQGWSVKKMLRTLVLSSSYRMDSREDEEAEAADPQDVLLHRMRLRRLEGEAIRDAILAVSGRLDRRLYGHPVPIHLTPFLEGRGRPTSGPLDGGGRRSVYLAVRRNFLSPFLGGFDTPIPFSTVGRRAVSNVPAQALILLNDPFVHRQARLWAEKVLATEATPRERVTRMYLAAFARPPQEAEFQSCESFLRSTAALHEVGADDPWPWAELAHSIINAKEFIFIR